MTVGPILIVLCIIQVIWMTWSIRRYDPNRVSVVQTALHDITRTKLRPKTKLGVMIERSSNWVGLLMGFVIISLGLVFTAME